MTGWARMRAANARTAAASHRGEAEHLRATAVPGDPSAADQIAKSLAMAGIAEHDAEVYGGVAWHEAAAQAAANLAQAGADLEVIRDALPELAAVTAA